MEQGEMIVALASIILGSLIFLIPIAGLTARFALKPIMEAISKMRDGGIGQQEIQLLSQRISLLESQIQGIESTVERIADVREFDRQLSAPKDIIG